MVRSDIDYDFKLFNLHSLLSFSSKSGETNGNLAAKNLLRGIRMRRGDSVYLAIVSGFLPGLLLWAAYIESFRLYIISFGNIVWV